MGVRSARTYSGSMASKVRNPNIFIGDSSARAFMRGEVGKP
jgi:hypothetical protein